ncbi:MAG: PIN domain-containing protein [Candidatus Aenigmarchaeota archaeon]|nr:PIN domain-containing protein [Candidatus Aenigmarchaeota archaeon]
MNLALDTNILIEIDRLNKKIIEKLESLRKEEQLDPTLPALVVLEYYYGFLDSRKKESALKNINKYTILNTSKGSSLLSAEIKHKLERAGQIIPDIDIIIAAICIDNNAILVTSDKQFEKIKELNKIILDV